VLPTSLPEPWWDLSDGGETETKVRDAYDEELRRELGDGHPLAGRERQTLAKCGGCDRALVRLDRDEWALVHLTWSSTKERPGWPTVDALGPWDDVHVTAAAHTASH
jgi:hypothetical protein